MLDLFGNALVGNQGGDNFAFSFTTEDRTPPAPPPIGSITMSVPDDDGLVHIVGGPGTTEGGALIFATNESTGATTTVLADFSGGFALDMNVALSDRIVLTIRDAAGNQTLFSPGLFDTQEGEAIVAAPGGTMRLADGSQFVFFPGSFDRPTTVEIERVDEASFVAPTPTDFNLEFEAGFTIDTGGAELLEPMDLRIPASRAYPEGSVFLVTQVVEQNGEQVQLLWEKATYESSATHPNGEIVINSPPFPGVWLGTFATIGLYHATPIRAFRSLLAM